MNVQEILQIVQAATALIESLKGLGLDLSGVKLHTSQPLDLSALMGRLK